MTFAEHKSFHLW